MKQFNLEEYLKNPECKVVTRYGMPVRIVCTDAKSSIDGPIIALVSYNDTEERVFKFRENGQYLNTRECEIDLFFAPQIHKRYGIYCSDFHNLMLIQMPLFDTKEEAEEHLKYGKVVEITWEE